MGDVDAIESGKQEYTLRPRNRDWTERTKVWFKTNLLIIFTIASVLCGIFLGIGLRSVEPSKDAILLIGFPGDVLMRMLKMLILPLIVSSLITGESSLML